MMSTRLSLLLMAVFCIVNVAALFLTTGTAYAEESNEVLTERCKNGATYWCGILDKRNERHCTQTLAPVSTKPFTPKQLWTYKELLKAGLSEKDAAQAARDPGVKKGEWGWTQGDDDSGNPKCVKKEGSEWLAKYKNNVVVE
jgi:hypothetical protein